jgi:hypothetical protein
MNIDVNELMLDENWDLTVEVGEVDDETEEN